MSPPDVTELPRCSCGQVHQLADPLAHWVACYWIDQLGERVTVTTPAGSWEVPRVWIAVHGLAAEDLPLLAAVYGWARTP